MDTETIIIDGYNVIRRVPSLRAAEARGLAAGRDALLAQVVATYRQRSQRVLVVFDGAEATQRVAPLRCGTHSQVIFSAHGDTADSVIARLVEIERQNRGHVVVATDDLAVRLNSQRDGAATASASELARHLGAAPRHLERAARYRAAVRAQLERDADGDVEDSRDSRGNRKGNPRRAPRRRRGQATRRPL